MNSYEHDLNKSVVRSSWSCPVHSDPLEGSKNTQHEPRVLHVIPNEAGREEKSNLSARLHLAYWYLYILICSVIFFILLI